MNGAERWRILRLHVEDKIPLAELARESKVSLRTLERWHRLFQDGGIGALDQRPRVDAGRRRTAAETVAFIEAARARRRELLRTINDCIPTFADREQPRISEAPRRRLRLRTYEED